MARLASSLSAGILLLAFAGCAADSTSDANMTTTPSGLKYADERVGSGPEVKKGDLVSIHYTGRLKNGVKFDSSHDVNHPLDFVLGSGKVIKGWDEGIAGMKVGGRRKLVIPPDLAYGDRGYGDLIPPRAELTFDVELVKMTPANGS
jgi:peptidylprolyl isomerase